MLKFIIAAVALLAVAGGLAYWTYGQGGDSAEAEVQVIRWVNVTVEVPENSGIIAVQGSTGPGSVPAMILTTSHGDRPESSLVIDAETGKVIADHVQPEDRAATDEVLQTLIVSPLDRSVAPWPYSGEPPKVPPHREGNITFILPDPAAGIRITVEIGDGGGAERTSNTSIQVHNGRSAFWIDVATGEASYDTAILVPEDKEAFDRFLSAVEYVGTTGERVSP